MSDDATTVISMPLLKLIARLSVLSGRIGLDSGAFTKHLSLYGADHLASTFLVASVPLESCTLLTPKQGGWSPTVLSQLAPKDALLARAAIAAKAPGALIGRRFMRGKSDPVVYADAAWSTDEVDRVLAALGIDDEARGGVADFLGALPAGVGDSVRIISAAPASRIAIRRQLKVQGQAATVELGTSLVRLMNGLLLNPKHVAFIEDTFERLCPPGPEHALSVSLVLEGGHLVRALDLELVGLPSTLVSDVLLDFGHSREVAATLGTLETVVGAQPDAAGERRIDSVTLGFSDSPDAARVSLGWTVR